jgi:long-subunit fatty acid transport protein
VEYLEIANPNPVGSGARALGMGNAFIAVADDATAASWNPGGLSQLESPEVSFAMDYVSSTLDVDGYGDDTLSLHDFNYASLVYPFHVQGRHMVVSLNYFKMFRFEQEMQFPYLSVFPRGTWMNSFDQEGEFSVLSAAYGLDLTPKLSLGVSFNVWNHDITGNSRFQQDKVDSFDGIDPFGNPNQILYDRTNSYEVEEGYSWLVGTVYRFSKSWSFGAVVKPAYRLNLLHEHTGFTKILMGAFEQTNYDVPLDEEVKLDFPLVLAAGAAWRPADQLTLSLDCTWTQWSQYRYHEADGTDSNPVDDSSDDLQDTYTARLGGEYLIILPDQVIALRAGFGYDPAPAVGTVGDYYTVSCGLGVQFVKRFNLDLAYQYKWGGDIGASSVQGLDTTIGSSEHRVMVSLICYFQ